MGVGWLGGAEPDFELLLADPERGILRGSWNATEMPVPGNDRYRPLWGYARALAVLLGGLVVLQLIAIWSDLDVLSFLHRARDGEIVTLGEANAIDDRQALLGGVDGVLVLVTAIIWIIWFRAAYRNLQTFGVRFLRFKPGWAVGGWFVPILSLIRPKEIANDIWRASDPSLTAAQERVPSGGHIPMWMNLWWATFILSGITFRVSSTSTPNEIDDFIGLARKILFADLFHGISAVLALFVVLGITTRQTERHQTTPTTAPLPDLSAPPPPFPTPVDPQSGKTGS